MESNKDNTKDHVHKTETDKVFETKLVVTKWETGGGIDWEVRTDIYTLLYVEQMSNKDLLYSTGNLYSGGAHMGKHF